MRIGMIVMWMFLCSIAPAAAQVSVSIGFPGVNIGINVPVYPQLVAVPGYPVYYAPQVNSNYFFYDGIYWVYQRDNWYASSWYNGPWALVAPDVVPLFVLRVPVRYYRNAPAYFHGWRADASPRWGQHWGNSWEQSHSGWDTWNHRSVPAPAPLPVYQRQYSGNRYPHTEQQQQVLQTNNYHYQPHEAVVQQHYQAPRVQSQPAPSQQVRQPRPQAKAPAQHDERGSSRSSPVQQGATVTPSRQPPQNESRATQKNTTRTSATPQKVEPTARQRQQPPPAAAQHQQQAPKVHAPDKGSQGKKPAQEPKQGQEKDHEKGDQGGESNK